MYQGRNRARAITALAALALLLPGPAGAKNYDYSGTEINQKDAGGYASNNYWNGSGDSKDEGVRNAMRALNHLAALDIGGAVHYGYKGYGNYINSQKMDDLDSAAWKSKGSMDSIGSPLLSGASGNGAGQNGGGNPSALGPERDPAHLPAGSNGAKDASGESSVTSHKLADMDRSFLYRGETGDVAAEFEKKSGMSREEFFNQLANAEASGLSWDDPNLMEKGEALYQRFISKIPNKDYRTNLERAHSLFTLAKKMQIMEEAAAFYKKMRWGDGSPSKVANDANGNGSGAAEQAAAAGQGAPDAGRAPASAEPAAVVAAKEATDEKPKLSKEQMGMYLGLEGSHGDDLKDFIGPDDTIFHLVSKRYRKLTPMMIGKVM
jgi:hypothetical protein